jgi:hypothetical protein
METLMRYRGREVTGEEVVFIREFIARNSGDSRWMLSRKLCQVWDWRQPNGALRDMVCRGLMLQLSRAGHIELPPTRMKILNPLVHRKKPLRVEIDQTAIEGKLSDIGPIEFSQVRRTDAEALFNSLIEEHHYLGYCQPVGEHLKYLVFANGRPIACLVWSSAPRHIGSRDRFIGWTKPLREKNLSLIACNTRFLILPWVRVPHLASHLLGKMAKMVSGDWERFYCHPLHYLETFVDRDRFRGTCYLAANWINVGKTTGRGKNDQTGRANRSLKDVLGYPLSRDFRAHLCGGQP